jgi:DNA-binding GntR family transcriptional regulator
MAEAVFAIEKMSLSQQIYMHIKRRILSGGLKSGQRIDEERIAAEFGTSRTPVREAFRGLEIYGLLKVKPRSYAEVAQLDPDEAEHISLIRSELEGLAVRLLAKKATGEDIAALEKITEESKKLIQKKDIGGILIADSRFHLEIAARSGNKYLYEILERLDAKVQLIRLSAPITGKKIREDIRLHESVIATIQRHEGKEAEKLITEHIFKSFQN